MSRAPNELRWPAIRLIPVRDAAADPGPSRFGGLPKVPAGFEWLRYKSRPMSEADLRALASFRLKFGLPDVPAGSERPRDADRPLDFLLQVDLRDLAGLRSNLDLPETGRLLFFYDAET